MHDAIILDAYVSTWSGIHIKWYGLTADISFNQPFTDLVSDIRLGFAVAENQTED